MYESNRLKPTDIILKLCIVSAEAEQQPIPLKAKAILVLKCDYS